MNWDRGVNCWDPVLMFFIVRDFEVVGIEMASPKNEGFLTDQQREVLKIAVQNAEVLSSSPQSPSKISPRSPTASLREHHHKNAVGGRAPAVGGGLRHVRRSHSGKFVKVKKG